MSDKIFRDSDGRTLADYERPSIAVDTALLIPDLAKGLRVLQVKRHPTSDWALPGTFLWKGERLADAVERSLQVKAGVHGLTPHQLRVFDDPDRDDRGWVISVAHWAAVRPDQLSSRSAPQTRLVPVGRPGRLIYDHRLIIAEAVRHLRTRYAKHPDPDLLLGDEFTVRQLRLLHETIAGEAHDRDWFRREMRERLTATGELSQGFRGRPAELFRRRAS